MKGKKITTIVVDEPFTDKPVLVTIDDELILVRMRKMTEQEIQEVTLTEEKKRPSNPDYTSSAVKLVNPPEVKGLLDEWVVAKKIADEADTDLEFARAATPETPEEIKVKKARAKLADLRTMLEGAVKEFGGYQDTELGLYALQQTRKQVSYDPEKVKELIPTFADKILSQVDTAVLKGLLKGKLITQEQVDGCTLTKESLRFVIEAGE